MHLFSDSLTRLSIMIGEIIMRCMLMACMSAYDIFLWNTPWIWENKLRRLFWLNHEHDALPREDSFGRYFWRWTLFLAVWNQVAVAKTAGRECLHIPVGFSFLSSFAQEDDMERNYWKQ